jgi:cytosine/adenosine deaminase-related metal-dependent hydrolase
MAGAGLVTTPGLRLFHRHDAAQAIAAAAARVRVRELPVSNSRALTTRGSETDSAESKKRLIERLTRASTYTARPRPPSRE